MPDVKLGLIGDDVTRSKAPRPHRLAGALSGLRLTYDCLVPRDKGATRLAVPSGCELFFPQGIDAFRVFCGREVDQPALRAALSREAA